jgi:carbon storage regulator
MLVLTRGVDEAIMIGEDIEITIVGIRGNKVRLGIKAPKSTPVHRKEIYLLIKEENIKAAQIETDLVERLAGVGNKLEQKGKK